MNRYTLKYYKSKLYMYTLKLSEVSSWNSHLPSVLDSVGHFSQREKKTQNHQMTLVTLCTCHLGLMSWRRSAESQHPYYPFGQGHDKYMSLTTQIRYTLHVLSFPTYSSKNKRDKWQLSNKRKQICHRSPKTLLG